MAGTKEKALVKSNATKKDDKAAPAKKAPAKKAPPSPEKDSRRAYEHLARVQALLGALPKDHADVEQVLELATRVFQDGKYKDAAELLRAAEHLLFAECLSEDRADVSPGLRKEIESEVGHLKDKAEERAEPKQMDKAVKALFERMKKSARASFRDGAYRAALEFARGAEALSHVRGLSKAALPDGASKRLAGE